MLFNDSQIFNKKGRKYKSVLEEIKNIAEYECVSCEHPGDCYPLCDKFKIKNKINEVLNNVESK
jgi:hypothetical protein